VGSREWSSDEHTSLLRCVVTISHFHISLSFVSKAGANPGGVLRVVQ
jgi:hypothetical protein